MESKVYRHLGQKVKEARDQKGWTQQELSDRIQLTRTSVANIEAGRQKIQIHVLYELADALGTTPHELIPTKDQIANDIIKEEDIPYRVDDIDEKGIEFMKNMFTKLKVMGDKNESDES